MPFSFKDLPVLKSLGFGKRQGVVGIDIGSSGIKIVQLRNEQERAILETYGELALGPYAKANVGQAVNLPPEKIVEALKDLTREAGVTSKKAVVSLPLKSSFVTVINLPVIEGRDMSEMIGLEARRYIPVPLSEVETDWWVLPEALGIEKREMEEKPKFAKVLLVAIHKDAIQKHRDIVHRAGFEISALELDVFSEARSSVSRKSSSSIAILDFGASSVKVAIFNLGVLMSSHMINKGGQDLTLAISHSMGVDFSRAEEMKREIGLSNLPEHREIKNIIEPILLYIFSEIEKIIKAYQQKHRQSVSRIVLAGGGALLKGLLEFAVKNLAVEASLADPFAKTEFPLFLAESLKQIGPDFAISLGSALRGM